VVEKFNDHYRQKFLGKITMTSMMAQYEYVVATNDVKEQKLKLLLGKTQLEEFNYPLR